MTDTQLKRRMTGAVDPLAIDVEAQLRHLHGAGRSRDRRRKAGACAIAGIVALGAAVTLWQLRPSEAPGITTSPDPSGKILILDASTEGAWTVAAHDLAGGATGSPIEIDAESLPVLSPDGSEVAWVRTGDEAAIVVAELDGGSVREHLSGTWAEPEIAWNADGSSLYYLEADGRGNTVVNVVELTTDSVQRVTEVPAGYWRGLDVSPDGSLIALAGGLASDDTIAEESEGLWLVGPDGTPIQLVSGETVEFVSFSPDGSRIAFGLRDQKDEGDYRWDVWVVNTDGTGLTRITDEPGWDHVPVWSPDAEWIAFMSDRGASEEQRVTNAAGEGFSGATVYVVSADGTDVRAILPASDDKILAPVGWAA
jgi:Tol biopolymer transport system component